MVRLWDAQTGKEVDGFSGRKNVTSLTFIPAGDGETKVLATVGADNVMRFWELPTGRQFLRTINLPSAATVIAVSPDGKLIATGGPERRFSCGT